MQQNAVREWPLMGKMRVASKEEGGQVGGGERQDLSHAGESYQTSSSQEHPTYLAGSNFATSLRSCGPH